MINTIDHIINIDLANKININKQINIKQNDTNSHKFVINIFNNSLAYDLTGTTARIYFQKADDTKVFLDCTLDDVLTGKISCLLTTQVSSYAGLVASEITIYGTAGEILTSVTFNFTVSEVIRDDVAIESTSEFTSLTAAIVKLDGWDADFQTKYEGLNAEYAAELVSQAEHLADNTIELLTKLSKADLQTLIGFADLNKNISLIDSTMLTPELLEMIAGTAGVNVTPLALSVLTTHLANLAVTYQKTDFLVPAKNLFDKSKATINGYWVGYDVPSTITGYQASEIFPIVGGQSYTIQKARTHQFFDVNKNCIMETVVNDSSYATKTVVSPANAYYMATSTSDDYVGILQVELGTVATNYEAFGYTMPSLLLNDKVALLENTSTENPKISVVKSGEVFEISSKLGNDDITIKTTRSGSSNGAFNFDETRLNGEIIHVNPDDIAPIRTFTTVGANHGYPNVAIIEMASHGKTSVDLGSMWTDGVTQYTLLKIDGNNLTFGCPYTIDVDGIVSSVAIAPIANLTHVSGSTSTTDVNIAIKSSSPQLYPSTNNKVVKYMRDGKEITTDGTYYGEELQVQESYNIMCYKEILDFAQNNIGVSYANDNVGGVVKLSVTYTFTKGCNCHISHSFKALKKVIITNCGFIQSSPMSVTGHKIFRYLPNVLPKSGVDFKALVDMSTYNQSLVFNNADYSDANIPPNRHIDWLKNTTTGVKKIGFTMGYITDKTNSKNTDRLINTPSGWDMRDTTKSYPIAMSGLTLNADDYKTFMAYRCYIPAMEATNINIIEDAKDIYVYIDYHTDVSFANVNLNDHIGKSIIVLEKSADITIHSDIVDVEGVIFSVANSYGYAILKLS